MDYVIFPWYAYHRFRLAYHVAAPVSHTITSVHSNWDFSCHLIPGSRKHLLSRHYTHPAPITFLFIDILDKSWSPFLTRLCFSLIICGIIIKLTAQFFISTPTISMFLDLQAGQIMFFPSPLNLFSQSGKCILSSHFYVFYIEFRYISDHAHIFSPQFHVYICQCPFFIPW